MLSVYLLHFEQNTMAYGLCPTLCCCSALSSPFATVTWLYRSLISPLLSPDYPVVESPSPLNSAKSGFSWMNCCAWFHNRTCVVYDLYKLALAPASYTACLWMQWVVTSRAKSYLLISVQERLYNSAVAKVAICATLGSGFFVVVVELVPEDTFSFLNSFNNKWTWTYFRCCRKP